MNRIIWIVLFLSGTAVFAWQEWYDSSGSSMVWFIFTSLWSAICAIGYTILDWFLVNRKT